MVVEADTTTETEGVAVECNPATGVVDNVRDRAEIISSATVAGGDNPANFVGALGTGRFRMNAATVNPGDGTEIISRSGSTPCRSTIRAICCCSATATAATTEVVNHTLAPHIFAGLCGSFCEQTPNNYLIDFATADNDTNAEIQANNPANSLVFDLQSAQTSATHVCGAGWNAFPLPNTILTFREASRRRRPGLCPGPAKGQSPLGTPCDGEGFQGPALGGVQGQSPCPFAHSRLRTWSTRKL